MVKLMPKPEIIISFFGKVPSKKEDVTNICMGDFDGDGDKEIIFGGKERDNCTLLRIIKKVDSKYEMILNYSHYNGFIRVVECFDINNDGKDEIIYGDSGGGLYYLDIKKGNVPQKVKLAILTKDITCIKALYEKEKSFIIVGVENEIQIFSFENEIPRLFETLNFKSRVLSVLPIKNDNNIILLVGREGHLSVLTLQIKTINIEIVEEIELYLPPFQKEQNSQLSPERVYDICLIGKENNQIKFACGCRSGKIYYFCLSEDLHLLQELQTEAKSIYKLNFFDVDNCGTKELSIIGKGIKDQEEYGCLEIFKFESEKFRHSYSKTYEKRIFSILPIEKKEDKKIDLFLSAASRPLVCFKVTTNEHVENGIRLLASEILKKNGEFCLFLGAGISAQVFPLADQISRKIIENKANGKTDIVFNYLEKIPEFKEHFECYYKRAADAIPLEGTLFWYKNSNDRKSMIETLRTFFEVEENIKIPYSFEVIAELIRLNKINYVFTVNYDTLLEEIIEDKNMQNVMNLFKQNDFKSVNICHKKAILKLHGSIHEPESIAGALDEVTELKENKRQVLDFILNGHKVVFIGYSFRDLDIYPVLKRTVKQYKTSCYFVNPADPTETIEEILNLSGQGDIDSRYFQIKSDLFFEYLSENIPDLKASTSE